jgi:hypothetical protein
MWFSYSQLVLIFLAALLVLLVLFLFFRRTSEAADLFAARPDAGQDYFLPVLVHEIRYPSFGKILALVFNHFGPERFLSNPEFKDAFEALRTAAFEKRHPKKVVADMSLIVRAFLSDPEVEYRFRKDLPPLVDLFLMEIQKGATGPSSSSE